MLEDGEKMFLYAPLTGILAQTDRQEIEALSTSISSGVILEELNELLCSDIKPQEPLTPEDLPEITILINQKCNFSCKYCYSAHGRSPVELHEEFFKPVVDWFIKRKRLERSGAEALSVTFSGGGDPMLSFDKVKDLIHRFRDKALKGNIPLNVGLVCNGSLVSAADADFLASNVHNIVVSFDVLEDVHNAQRSHYATVAQTIRHLCSKGIQVGLRATITALNVDRMEEMVSELAKNFPQCHSIAMEAVLASDLWGSTAELHDFYTRFVANYFEARRLGEQLGISVGNTIDFSADSIKSRACPGKMSVAPDGTLTVCSRVATPGDKFFSYFTFGKVDNYRLAMDWQKYSRLMAIRADNQSDCAGCFAKYHCGGGCLLARMSYTPAQMYEYCNFTRAMILKSLTYELD